VTRWRRRSAAIGIRAFVAVASGAFAHHSELRSAAPDSEPPARYSIRWVAHSSDQSRVAVEVTGLSAAEVAELRKAPRPLEQWQRVLSVYAGQGDLVTDIGLPAMLGAYSITSNILRFEPQFTFTAGVNYRAAFHPAQLPGARNQARQPVSSQFQLSARRSTPATVVTRVYPTAEVLPENVLKFYVCFSAPMSGGHIYEHIHLRNDAGKDVELPFLEIDEELWNPQMNRLTLFIDPGRIKREVKPLEEIGPALEEGKRYALVIDKAWKDADGIPMKESFTKAFRVGPPDREAIDTAQWKLSPPLAGARSPLVVAFPKPMDHALARRLIHVTRPSGELINGTSAMEDYERRWAFVPENPWIPGNYRLTIQTTIEDLAGNNIGKSFEVDLFEGVQRRLTNFTVKLPFDVRAP
jgi:hypothetical protein